MKEKPLADDELLWRRIHPKQIVNGRVSSEAFFDPEMSVDVASIQKCMANTLETGSGIAELSCRSARKLNQCVTTDPLPSNAAHAIVRGKKTKSTRRKLRDEARFFSKEQILECTT